MEAHLRLRHIKLTVTLSEQCGPNCGTRSGYRTEVDMQSVGVILVAVAASIAGIAALGAALVSPDVKVSGIGLAIAAPSILFSLWLVRMRRE